LWYSTDRSGVSEWINTLVDSETKDEALIALAHAVLRDDANHAREIGASISNSEKRRSTLERMHR
jgi:hypothetical protein